MVASTLDLIEQSIQVNIFKFYINTTTYILIIIVKRPNNIGTTYARNGWYTLLF